MKAYLFPGQASQFTGMGQDLYEQYPVARQLFHQANDLLGFDLAHVMFTGSEEDLKETRVTQPSVFLHAVIKAVLAGHSFQPDMVAGHSLGEFSALVAAKALDFEDGLLLVYRRAMAMQKACDNQPGTMAAVLGLEDEQVEKVCAGIPETVVPANYNCPGQLVISGSLSGVQQAVEALKTAGAKRAIIIPVGGAFHSPLMATAREELATAIEQTPFHRPVCPIYQNVDAQPYQDPAVIKKNLIAQLTAPVRWTAILQNMIAAGATEFIEVGGTGTVLTGFVKRINRDIPAFAL